MSRETRAIIVQLGTQLLNGERDAARAHLGTCTRDELIECAMSGTAGLLSSIIAGRPGDPVELWREFCVVYAELEERHR